jgi:hypothetical protein
MKGNVTGDRFFTLEQRNKSDSREVMKDIKEGQYIDKKMGK